MKFDRSLVAALAGLPFLLLAALPARAGVEIREVTSPGGIHAWLVEEHANPFVALELRFRGGASLDAPGRRGATNLMAGMLEEGAGEMDGRAFAEATEGLAAGFAFDAGDDTVSVSARMLTENRDQAVALLHEALIAPRFDAEALERVRGQVLAGIEGAKKDPGDIAGTEFARLAYGDHPYGSDSAGTEDSVQALTAEDLRAAKDNVMARDRVIVSAVGDITPEELGPLLDRLLGDLPATGAPMPAPVTPDFSAGISVTDFATPQSVVIFGQPGLKRDDPDFFAAYVLNQIVGGSGFSSRLMQEVREKRGLSYGAYSYLVPRDLAETWQGSFASSNDKVAEAVQVVQDLWADTAAKGVTQQELDAAKTYLVGSYPLRFDSNADIADILVGMQLDRLTPDYVDSRNAKIEAVTLEDVRRVAARWMQPGHLRFVVVGQPVGLKPSN